MNDPQQLNTLLPPRMLFRFAVPLYKRDPVCKPGELAPGDKFLLPDLAALEACTPSAEPRFAEVRAAWGSEGLAFWIQVEGKNQPLWCRDSRLEESDGLQVWIDTRATHNVHRATKFCHRFVFLPAGGGRNSAEPVVDQLLINRARENARPVRPRELQATSTVKKGGYKLTAFIPAVALGGFDPAQHPRLGFNYAVVDRERGIQTFSAGPGLPFDEDPSCWGTLELTAS